MYNENEKTIIWLTLFEQLTPIKISKLLNLYKEPSLILKNLVKDRSKIVKIVGEDIYQKMINTSNELLSNYINNLERAKIKCLTYLSTDYPSNLKDIDDFPPILFCNGDLSLLNKKSIAIVGTRNPSMYGRTVTEMFAKELAQKGLIIVSGLASGVDKIAHESALAVNGKTIAVLANGFDRIYPAMNTNLAERIAQKGLLISEYRPNIRATQYSFPYRNRIISALCDGVLITEAGEKSGSLYTKNYALEQNRELFVVPSNINNIRAKGSNKVLKNLQGAMVTSPDDILLQFGLPIGKEKEIVKVQTSLTEQMIIVALQDGEKSFENLQELTKLETKKLNSCLTMLQIRGLIKRLPANMFAV